MTMSDDSFRRAHPLLYHLQNHCREYSFAALALVAGMWFLLELTMAMKRVDRSFCEFSTRGSIPRRAYR